MKKLLLNFSFLFTLAITVSIAFGQNARNSFSQNTNSSGTSVTNVIERNAPVMLTHSVDPLTVAAGSISCNAGGLHADNAYLRVFDMDAMGVVGDLEVSSVDFGIETATGAAGTQPVVINLYTLVGALEYANMNLEASESIDLADAASIIFNQPISATIPAGSILVAEIFTPDGQGDGHSFFIGSNAAGQTDLSYLVAATCGAAEPTDIGGLGFPDMHLLIHVNGEDEAGGGGCVTEQEDDLESYTLGSMEGQSANWVGWTPLSAEYGEVSNEQANSGTQSLKIEGIPAGGPVDQLYLLGDRTVGDWDLSLWMYVPSGNSGYYNLQADQVPAVEWKHELYLFSDGSGGALTINGAAGGVIPAYPQDAWFEIFQHIDQINDVTELYLDGNLIYSGSFSGGLLNQIGGFDFFPATNPADPNPNAIPLYYLDDVEMCANPFIPPPPSNNECAGIINISSLLGAPVGSPQTGGPYDNSSATTEASDPADGWECYGALAPEPSLDNTLWFAFVGDGNTYDIITTDCGGGLANYIDDGDTQMSIYTGSCGALTPHSCNEDAQIIPPNEYPAGFVGTETFSTDVGVTYYVMVDGFNFQGALSSGEYCIEITRTDNTGIEDVTSSEFGLVSVSPNPATNQIQIELSNAQARELNISIMSINGQQVYSRIATSNAGTDIIPINVESLAAGMYILQMRDEQAVTNVKFVVE